MVKLFQHDDDGDELRYELNNGLKNSMLHRPMKRDSKHRSGRVTSINLPCLSDFFLLQLLHRFKCLRGALAYTLGEITNKCMAGMPRKEGQDTFKSAQELASTVYE